MEKCAAVKRRNLAVFIAIAGLSGNAVAIEPASIPLGGISLTPTVTLKQGHEDNLFSASDNEKSSNITVISPTLELSAQERSNKYAISVSAEKGIYHQSTNDNYTDARVAATADMTFDVRKKLLLLAEYLKKHEMRGSGLTEGDDAELYDTPVKYNESNFLATYTYGADNAQGRLVGKIRASQRDYQNFPSLTSNRDRSSRGADLTFYYKVMSKTSVLAEVSGTTFDYKNQTSAATNLDSTEMKYLVGATWDATAKTTGSIKFGHTTKDFESTVRDEKSAFTWNGQVEWSPRTYSTFTLITRQSFEESSGQESAIDTQVWQLLWNHGWTDRVSSNLGYSVMNEEYSETNRNDDTTKISLGLDYQLQRWLSVSADFVNTVRDSDIAEFDYENNAFYVTLQASM